MLCLALKVNHNLTKCHSQRQLRIVEGAALARSNTTPGTVAVQPSDSDSTLLG